MGTATDISIAEVVDESKSLIDGAITVPGYKPGGWSVRMFSESEDFDPDKPVADFDENERHYLLYAEGEKVRINGTNITFDGLIPRIQRSFLSKDRDSMQKHIREFVDRAVVFTTCPECAGTRLNTAARSSLIAGKSIADVCALGRNHLFGYGAHGRRVRTLRRVRGQGLPNRGARVHLGRTEYT
ncbi:hypothetical protein [Brevibacterium iodinum]|uniref:hypothetical protein n=1 Tax=Brevibacterium iodinum TaxID=31943 RepID=UPI0030B83124